MKDITTELCTSTLRKMDVRTAAAPFTVGAVDGALLPSVCPFCVGARLGADVVDAVGPAVGAVLGARVCPFCVGARLGAVVVNSWASVGAVLGARVCPFCVGALVGERLVSTVGVFVGMPVVFCLTEHCPLLSLAASYLQ